MSTELACLPQIAESSLLNCFVFKLHLPFLHPRILSSKGLTPVFHWDPHIGKNESQSLVKMLFLLFSENLKAGESFDHFAKCVSLLSSSSLVNNDRKLFTRAVREREFWVLWECYFWLAICCVMNGQAGRMGLHANSIKCLVVWCYHSNEDDVWWIIIHEMLSYFFKSFLCYLQKNIPFVKHALNSLVEISKI